MKRELLDTLPNGDMLAVDTYTDVFGKPLFTARKIVRELRPTTVCKTIGTFKTRVEAVLALNIQKPQDGQ